MDHSSKQKGIAQEQPTAPNSENEETNIIIDGGIKDSEAQQPSPTGTGTTIEDGKAEEEYPEGGARAWSSVFGSFCGMMCCFGMMNTIGTFQAYLSTHQLKAYSPSDVGWIFSIYLFVSYLGGLQVGQIFDAIGPRILVCLGSTCLLACMFLLGPCTKYWHFALVYGILGGVGTSLISTPCLASIGHFFQRRRGTATGLASCGGSIGGVVFPLILQAIFAKSGFGWATRALGFIYLFLLTFANLLVRSRLPAKPLSRENVMPDLRMFKDLTLVVMTIGVFLIEWGMFMPITYITSFALHTGMRSSLAYQLLAIFNAGSFFGRWIPGHIADAIGRVNTSTLHILLSVIATFAFWLPASLVSLNVSTPLIIIFAVIFGYSSGSNISLAPVCFGQLCKTEDYGRYMATCFTIVGFGMLVGIPIGGGILQAGGGSYIGLISFTGACYAVGMVFFIWARVRAVGWGIRSFF